MAAPGVAKICLTLIFVASFSIEQESINKHVTVVVTSSTLLFCHLHIKAKMWVDTSIPNARLRKVSTNLPTETIGMQIRNPVSTFYPCNAMHFTRQLTIPRYEPKVVHE